MKKESEEEEAGGKLNISSVLQQSRRLYLTTKVNVIISYSQAGMNVLLFLKLFVCH